MNQKIYNLNEIADAIAAYKYKRCEILTQDGQKATTSHKATEAPGKWIRGHVAEWAKRPLTAAGYYFVYCYSDPGKKNKPDVYTFKVGNPPTLGEPTPAAPIIIQQPQAQPIDNPLSWDSALKYQNEISNLKSENTRLLMEIEHLKNKINDLETLSEDDDEPEPMGGLLNENFLSGTVMPALNAFFDNQKQNRHVKFYEMAAKNPALWHTPLGMQILHEGGGAAPAPAPIPKPRPQPKPQPDYTNINVQLSNEFFETLDDDDFTLIEEIKNNSTNLDEFFNSVKNNTPGLYDSLKAYVNAKGGRL